MYATTTLFCKRKNNTDIYHFLLIFVDCPVNFKHQNYSIITRRCKGPRYYGRMCCPALKEFACPFADHLNDVHQNDCASIMFSFITHNGRYPPGLFFDKCVEGSFGLTCPDAWDVPRIDDLTSRAYFC